jgi:uncharacterized membrane protein YuzA (DUF378 family)
VVLLHCLLTLLVALVFGTVGVFQKSRNRVPAVIGTCLSGSIFLLVAGIAVMAWLSSMLQGQSPAL